MLIEVSDPDQGVVQFSVPLNSSIRFSPLYDPRSNLEEAKRGFKFDTAGDILAAKVNQHRQLIVACYILTEYSTLPAFDLQCRLPIFK